jgi:hypothetical protein
MVEDLSENVMPPKNKNERSKFQWPKPVRESYLTRGTQMLFSQRMQGVSNYD